MTTDDYQAEADAELLNGRINVLIGNMEDALSALSFRRGQSEGWPVAVARGIQEDASLLAELLAAQSGE